MGEEFMKWRPSGHIMRDKSFELETKLVLLNFYEHTCHGRSHSCDLTGGKYGLVPSDVASRRYRSLPESSRERSPSNHNGSQPESPEAKFCRTDLRPEILNLRFLQNSSENSSGSFDGSNMDADDELDSNPSLASFLSQNNSATFDKRKNRLSTVFSESDFSLSPEIGRNQPPNNFAQVFKDSLEESSNLQVDGICSDDNSSSSDSSPHSSSGSKGTSPDDELDTFRDEVRNMMENLQSENEELKSLGNTPDSDGQSRPLSPISDAARKLGKISDEIQETYGPRIEQSLCSLCSEHLTYEEFSGILNGLLGPAEADWVMISAVMLFSKRCARYFFNRGINYMSQILDFTTNYLEDVAADFIINNGGWTTVNQISEDRLLEGGFSTSETSDSDNNPSNYLLPSQETLTNSPLNGNSNASINPENISTTPLQYINPQESSSPNSSSNLDPTAVVALAAVICASFIYLTS